MRLIFKLYSLYEYFFDRWSYQIKREIPIPSSKKICVIYLATNKFTSEQKVKVKYIKIAKS